MWNMDDVKNPHDGFKFGQEFKLAKSVMLKHVCLFLFRRKINEEEEV